MSRFFSESLGKRDRSSFASGNEKIDHYFLNTVGQDVKRRYAACYVLVERDTGRLAGFYTLSANGVPLMDLPADVVKKLPRYPTVPAVLIGWLGRDSTFRGQDVGQLLLYDAIARVLASPIGAYAIFADAIDGAASAFYRKHLFSPLTSRPNTLFLPLATATALMREPL